MERNTIGWPALLRPESGSIFISTSYALDGLPSLALAPSYVYVPYLHEESHAQRVAACAALRERGMAARIVTQFSFDAGRVLDWLGELRAQGVTVPIRVGIPGPAGVRTLLRGAGSVRRLRRWRATGCRWGG